MSSCDLRDAIHEPEAGPTTSQRTEIFDATSGVRWFVTWRDAVEAACARAFLDALTGGRFGDPADDARPDFYLIETIAALDAFARFRADVIGRRADPQGALAPPSDDT